MFWGGFVLHCEGMSEDLTEGQTPWGYCKREDAEDSLVQCADRTERSQSSCKVWSLEETASLSTSQPRSRDSSNKPLPRNRHWPGQGSQQHRQGPRGQEVPLSVQVCSYCCLLLIAILLLFGQF